MGAELSKYTGYHVGTVKHIKKGYGYIVTLILPDGSNKKQQISGFKSKRDAEKGRAQTLAELYSRTYVVYRNITVEEALTLWLEHLEGQEKSYSTISSFKYTVKNHIVPIYGKERLCTLTPADISRLYAEKDAYSHSVARQVKAIISLFMKYAVNMNMIKANPAQGVKLARSVNGNGYHQRRLDVQKTLTLEQVQCLVEKSKETKIYIMVLLNVLMGLRRSEILGIKYSDIDHKKRTLKVARQLGRKPGSQRDECAPKTFSKQEIHPKTQSSVRELPIPDVVYDAIMEERRTYEANRSRRKSSFQDLDYICCSSYGRPRCSTFHVPHYKKLLKECGLPDIRWHDLRSTYCTILLKNNFSPKAISKLMGHSKEIITVDIYGDNKGILVDGVPEMDEFIKKLMPDRMGKGPLD